MYPLLTFALVVIPSASSQPPVKVDQPAVKVEWRQGHLSVTAENVPLSEILRAVVSKTGIEVVELEALEEEVSVQVSDLTLHEGLQKLLARVNYVLVERASPKRGRGPF